MSLCVIRLVSLTMMEFAVVFARPGECLIIIEQPGGTLAHTIGGKCHGQLNVLLEFEFNGKTNC